jgi:hypothetical protein
MISPITLCLTFLVEVAWVLGQINKNEFFTVQIFGSVSFGDHRDLHHCICIVFYWCRSSVVFPLETIGICIISFILFFYWCRSSVVFPLETIGICITSFVWFFIGADLRSCFLWRPSGSASFHLYRFLYWCRSSVVFPLRPSGSASFHLYCFLPVQIFGSVSFGDHRDLHHFICMFFSLVQIFGSVSFGDHRDLHHFICIVFYWFRSSVAFPLETIGICIISFILFFIGADLR